MSFIVNPKTGMSEPRTKDVTELGTLPKHRRPQSGRHVKLIVPPARTVLEARTSPSIRRHLHGQIRLRHTSASTSSKFLVTPSGALVRGGLHPAIANQRSCLSKVLVNVRLLDKFLLRLRAAHLSPGHRGLTLNAARSGPRPRPPIPHWIHRVGCRQPKIGVPVCSKSCADQMRMTRGNARVATLADAPHCILAQSIGS